MKIDPSDGNNHVRKQNPFTICCRAMGENCIKLLYFLFLETFC